MENIKVYIRIRPKNKKEENDNALIVDSNLDKITVSNQENKESVNFTFDKIYDYITSQDQLYKDIGEKPVKIVCDGYNTTIFAYGATGSGKTFTMFGSETVAGITQRACETLFTSISKNTVEYVVKCSFLEIYQERIRDLLDENQKWNENSDNNPNLKIRKNDIRGIYVQDLTEKFVNNTHDILEIIKEGAKQRSTGQTALNSVSSRSHSVLTISLKQTLSDKSEIYSKLNLIDLAGSENVGKSEVQGTALYEAKSINKSLSCLGNVIFSLEKKSDHIPYRDSKLTYLLQDSIGGNSKTIVIATISPSTECYYETLSTLKFAKTIKQIKNAPRQNKNESKENLLTIINELKNKNIELENACEELKNMVKTYETESLKSSNFEESNILKFKLNILEKKESSMRIEIDFNKDFKDKINQLFQERDILFDRTAEELYDNKMKISKMDDIIKHYDSLATVFLKKDNKLMINKIINEITVMKQNINLK